MDDKSSLIEKIQAKSANIERKEWILKDVKIFKSTDGIIKSKKIDEYIISPITIMKKSTAYSKISILCHSLIWQQGIILYLIRVTMKDL